MSTYIGLRCHMCNETTGCECRMYAKDELVELIAGGAAPLKLLLDISDISFDWPWCDAPNELAAFLVKHHRHTVRIYDEYGRDYDVMGRRAREDYEEL